jgi:hypothetical protein
MKTMAQVQAETLDDDVKRIVGAEQFANDWLLVTMNDQESYEMLMAEVKTRDSVADISDALRGEWEELAEQVVNLVEEKISPTASLLIAQMLQGQGSLPFDIIARQAIKSYEETL